MNFTRRTAQMLQEDHQATILVIEALDQMIARARKTAPDISDASVHSALDAAANTIGTEVSSHFAFEENDLFPLLEEYGDVAIGAHLRDEHATILPLGQEVARRATQALENGFSATDWPEFRSLAGELIERMFAHIQKEEMALLPMLEELLDSETDMELSSRYGDAS